MPDVAREKAALRRSALARRDAIAPDGRIERSLLAADLALELPAIDALRPGAVVAGFLPIGSEIDARPLLDALRRRNVRLALPVVVEHALVFRELTRTTPLVPAGFGTVGPGPDAAVLVPDLVIAPLAAFDRRGNRLGYGGGFYDRAAALMPHAVLVGLAFAEQEVDAVPVEGHDRPLHAVCTDREAFEV